MQWQEVCEHPGLQNLPFKIEINEKGQILMSPVKVYHSAFQGKISQLLPKHGVVLAECAIKTSKGTQVADIAWCSEARFKKIEREVECLIAPEICIEVLSFSNTSSEIEEKRMLYISVGAIEFWTCDENGNMAFFDANGPLKTSILMPEFPHKVKIIT
ncbi:MAG: Uma2 family endonuclease [Candidatus Competibacter sp.]|nr:Uma2 family endonuclease [Candidatus Competibacter sp.]MDG4583153.1 Uma2 family endonuclease [Candidatus Competibacter sp.]